MMHPDPALRPLERGIAKLGFDAALDQRSVPPRTHREADVADGEAVAVAGDAKFADVADPARDLFAFRAAFVEIVIARTENDTRHARQQRQVFFHDQNLRAEIDERSNV